MPSVRNDGPNPVFVEDIRIHRGQTTFVPEHKWKAFTSNEIAKRTVAPFLKVVAGKDAVEETPKDEKPTTDEFKEIFDKMLEEDPEKANDEWWLADGRPDARVMSDKMGRRISGTERNKAWESYINDNPNADGE